MTATIAWLATACSSGVGARSAAGRCDVRSTAPQPIVIENGHRVFVEPQVLAVTEHGSVLAGSPTYVWAKQMGYRLVDDSVVGVSVDAGGRGTAIRSPIPRPVRGPRAVIEPQDRLAVVLGVGHRTRDKVVTGYRFGWYYRGQWSRIESLPPINGELLADGASHLIALGNDGYAFAVPFAYGDRTDVAVFVRSRGVWRATVLPTRIAHYLTLEGSTKGELNVGVVHQDLTGADDHNSLWLYRSTDGEAWSQAQRVVHGLAHGPVHYPELTFIRGTLWASWLTDVGAPMLEARAIRVGDTAPPRRIASSASELFATVDSPQRLWLVHQQMPVAGPEDRLRVVLETGANGVAEIGAVDVPYKGPIRATSGKTTILVTGPVSGTPPDQPVVTSYIQQLVIACH